MFSVILCLVDSESTADAPLTTPTRARTTTTTTTRYLLRVLRLPTRQSIFQITEVAEWRNGAARSKSFPLLPPDLHNPLHHPLFVLACCFLFVCFYPPIVRKENCPGASVGTLSSPLPSSVFPSPDEDDSDDEVFGRRDHFFFIISLLARRC